MRAALLSFFVLLIPSLALADSAVVFNEIMYHPAGTNEAALEWIELHNQHAVDIDLSGWRLDGGIDFNFGEGTIIRAGGYLVVASSPTNLTAIGVTNVVGPFRNRLSNAGDRLVLRNNDSRIIDELTYNSELDWPVAPDGAGPSLTKRARNLRSANAANWRASHEIGGTPGRANSPTTVTANTTSQTLLPFLQAWRYNGDGIDLSTAWRMPGNTAYLSWPAGNGAFAVEDCGCLPLATNTVLSLTSPVNGQPVRTFYFRRDLSYAGAGPNATLGIRTLLDDGFVLYLNGAEIFRQGMPTGPIAHTNFAMTGVPDATLSALATLNVTNLSNGVNVLAAEVHQVSDGSTDVVFDLELSELTTIYATNFPAGYSPPPPAIAFNEFSSSTNTNFWVEIINYGSTNFDLGGAVLARFGGATNREFILPSTTLAPGAFLQLAKTDLDFGADSGDRLVLYTAGKSNVMDAAVAKKEPRARWPDGTGRWLLPTTLTPGASNAFVFHDELVINEIMYHAPPRPAQAALFTNELFVSITNQWRWFAAGAEPVGVWEAPGYDDSSWALGRGVFHAPTNLNLAVPKGTRLPLTNELGERIITFYFRTEFNFVGATNGLSLTLRPVVDDGAVFYLNGIEVHRMNLPTTNIQYGTLALTNVGLPAFGAPVTLAIANVVQGMNTLAVEVHQVVPNSSDVGFGCELATTRQLSPAHPFQESEESWVEIFNRSSNAVNLAGWRLDEGIDFRFDSNTVIAPGGHLVVAKDVGLMLSNYPGIAVVGPFTNKLSRNSDLISLKDPNNNPADEVRDFSGGRWAENADAGGSSLELRDPRADNASADAWAASDESSRATWQTYTLRGVSAPAQSGEPTLWHEFALCLLDGTGEMLLDDISVIETPATAPKQFLWNGTFDGGSAAHWRFLGNHRHSRVEAEPGNPGNYVLRLVSTGAGEYQGNQIETTLTNNVSVVDGREYEISFRAKWVAGKNLLNSRLYFNRLARTVPLPMPIQHGTPGARNSRYAPNMGPTFNNLAHAPVVPNASQPVAVSVEASDPDGISSLALRYSVNGGVWQSASMVSANGKQFSGMIPGQSAAAIVQFYVEGTDSLGATAFAPAGGANSRALYVVQDNQTISSGAHNFRLVMTPADAAFLHAPTNTLSNELLGSTVIYDESEAYYDVGVRLKGSFVGRNVPRVGFHLQFPDDQLFRGEHRIVSVDRSQHTGIGGVGEIIAKHVANRAGGIPSMYDDLARFIHQGAPSYTSMSSLRLTGFDGAWLDAQFNDGSDGEMFEVEVIRWNVATVDGNSESPKQVGNESGGTGYANLEVQDWGDANENYRWFLLKVNNRTEDDFARGIAWSKALGITGTNFDAQAAATMDVDEFLRVMAFQSLVGPADAYYTGGNIHNFRIFVRPEDQKVMYVPWDWDSSFQRSATASLFGGGNISKLLNNAHNHRQYLCHLNDIVRTTYNNAYMSRWTAHYGAIGQQDLSSVLNYITTRANYVLGQLPTATFAITNNGGNNFTVTNGMAVLGGTAPLSVNQIVVNGTAYPVTWISDTVWRITIPLSAGANSLAVNALDKRGLIISNAFDTITVTNTGPATLLPVIINEWMADNAGPGGIPDPADGLYQDWFELFNPNTNVVNLGGLHLTDVPSVPDKWRIPAGTFISARGFLLVWADNNTNQNSIPGGTNIDLHASFNLNNGGEAIGLFAADGITPISTVTFDSQFQNVSAGRFPDGSTNAAYFMTNFTPRAANTLTAPMILAALAVNSGVATLQWNATVGRTYQVEFADDLAPPSWTRSGTNILATNATASATDTVGTNAQRFYRVRLMN